MRSLAVEERMAEWVENIPSRRAVVMGMARTGCAAAAALARRGAEVVGTDMKEIPGLREELPQGVALELGCHREETFRRCDLLVVSPGIPATDRFIQTALAAGAEVISEIELAWRLTDPIALAWELSDAQPLAHYAPGTWGPKASEDFLREDGREWFF